MEKKHFKAAILQVVAVLGLTATAHFEAQTYTFDPSMSATGGTDGSGTWDAGMTSDWYNGSTNTAWDNDGSTSASIGVSTAGTATVPDTLTIASDTTIDVAGLTFNNVTPYLSSATGEETGYTIGATNSTSILNLEGTGQIVDNTSATTVSVISAGITGSVGLTKSGAGILALTGNDTYTGGTTISGGALQIGNGSNTGAIVGNIVDNSVLIYDNTGLTNLSATTTPTVTPAPIISGTGSLLLEAGTLILGGANTYSGGTTITAGTLDIGNTSALGSTTSGMTINGGTLDLEGISTTVGTLNGTGGVVTNSSPTTPATLTVGNGGTYGGVLENGLQTLALDEAGGTLILTGANTYTGGTTIGGTLQFGNGGATGSLNSSGAIANSGSLIFDSTSGTSLLSGNISGSGSLTQEGAGSTVILTGTESYTGATTIDAGTLQVGNGGTTGSLTAGANVTDDGSLVFDRLAATTTISGVISGSGSLTQDGSSSTLILTGANTYSGATDILAGTLQIGNGGTSGSINSATNITNNGTLVFDSTNTTAITQSGIISGTGALTQNGAGSTLILSSANTYTGVTTVNNGTIQVGNANALGASTSNVAINGGTLDLHGFSITLGTLSSTTTNGTILDNGGNVTLSVGSNGGSGTYSGLLANGTGTLALNLVGGLEVLSGANTFSGGTTLSGGTLQIGNTLALGLATNNLAINGGALDMHGFSITVNTLNGGTGSVTSLAGASTLTVSNGGFFAGTVNDGTGGTVGLTSTSGTLILAGANQYSGTTTISAGTLQFGSGGVGGTFNADDTGTAAIVDDGALIFDTASATAESYITGLLSGTGTLTQEGAGSTLVLTDANTFSGGTLIKAGTIETGNADALDGSSGTLTMTGGELDLHGTALTVDTLNGTAGTVLSNTGDATLTIANGGIYSGVLEDGSGGDLTLSVSGGTLILNGTDTYSGGTDVSSGATLQVGSGGAAGTIQSSGNISDMGAVVFDNSGSVTASGIISGSGSVTQRGIGVLTLSGVDSYTGATYVTGGGTLDLAASTGSLNTATRLTFSSAGGTFIYDNTGSTGAKSQGVGVLVFSGGEDVVQSTLGGASSANLTFSSLAARTAGATGNFVTSGGANGSTNTITITGQGTGFINAGTFFDGGTANANYAYYDSAGFVRGINYGVDPGSILSTGGATIATTDTGNASSTINSSSNVEITGAITAQTGITIGTLQISGANDFTQASDSTLTVGGILKSGGNASTISGGNLTSNSSTDLVIRTDEAGDMLTISDNITSSTTGGITKSGAGTLILSGNNAYTGTTTVDAGTLRMGSGTALGSASNGLVVNGGTLDLNGNALSVGSLNGGAGVILDNGGATTLTVADGGTFGGSLTNGTGTLSLTQTAGTLILTGANTYSGNTTVTAGTLQIGSAGTAGSLNTSGGISMGSGTALIFDNSSPGASSTIGGAITGGGSLTQEGAGSTLILAGADTYSGATTITAGTLQIGNGGTTGSITSSSVTDDGALVFDTTNTTPLTFDATISGTGSVTQEGAGSTLILGGANTYTGGTFVDAGTLELANGTGFGSGQNEVTVDGGIIDLHGISTTLANLDGTGGTVLTNTANATLTVTGGGTYGGNLTDGTGGVLTLVQTGGTLDLSGTNTYSGGTTITDGVLAVAAPGSLPGAVTIANNASLDLMGGGTYANSLSLVGIGSDAAGVEPVTGALYFSANNATANMTGPIVLNGATVFTENGTGTEGWNFTGGITGTGGLTLNATGTGNIVYGLGGTNTFTGGLTLTQTGQNSAAPAKNAEIQLLSANAIPNGTRLSLNSSSGLISTLDLNGFNVTLANLGGSVDGTSQIINSSATAAALTLANAGADTWSGLIGGTPYGGSTAGNNLSVILTGNTDLILTGQNTYTGGTTVATTSTLQVGNGGATGSFGSGPVTDNGALIFDVAAPVSVSSVISGTGTLTQESGFGETVTLSGADTYTGTTSLSGGNIDLAADTGSLNGTTGTALIFQAFDGTAGGIFNYDNTGSTGAKTQGMGALAFTAGDGTVQSTLGGASSATLTFTSLAARSAGATGNFVTSGGTNGSTNTITIDGEATGFINSGIFFDGGTANANYAYYDAGGFVRGINYGVDAGSILSAVGATIASSDTGNAASTITSSSHVEVTGPVTAQGTIQIGTLQIAGANNFTQTAGSTLTVEGILKSGGNAATISGGNLTSASTTDLVIRVDEAGDSLTISDPITSSTLGGITVSGAGTLILTGENTYTGGTTVDGGTLQVGNGGTAGTINGTGGLLVEGGSTVAFDNSSTSIFSGTISGAGALTQEGSGTLILTGGNTYTGVTTISSGVLQVGNGTSGTLNANTTVVDDSSLVLDTSSFGALITGTGSVTQYGTNALIITGNEIYTGATIIDGGGSLELFGAVGSLNGTTGTALTFNGAGGTFNYDNVGSESAKSQGMGALTFNSGDGEVLSTYGNSGSSATLSFTSLATRALGATGNFVTSGGANGSTNTITISGEATGFINAGVFFDGGTASADYAYYDAGGFVRGVNYGVDPNSILSTGGATITSADTGNAASTITNSSNVEITGAISAQTSTTIGTLQVAGAYNFIETSGSTLTVGGILKTGGGTSTMSGGSLTTGDATDLVIRADLASDTLDISDSITSSDTGGVTKSGAGTVVLLGSNAYTGTTTVNGGTLQLANSSALGSSSNALVVNGGILDVDGNAFTVGSLNGAAGAIENNGGTTTLTDSNGGAFAGVLENGTGTLALSQTGGTQILTGANTYTGGTTLTNSGTTLQIGNGGTTGSLSSTGNISLGNGTSVVFDNTTSTAATLGGVISGAGSLTQEGFGNTLILTNADTYSGGTTITAGTLQIGNGGTTGSIDTTANVTDNGALVFDTTNATPTTFGGIISGTGSLTQEGASNTLILTNANTYTGGTTVASGAILQLDNGGATGALSPTGPVTDNGSLIFDNTSTTNTLGGPITGTGTLTQEGAGNTLVLTGTDTYSGGTTITAGTLQIGNGGSTGSLSATANIADNSSLVFDSTNSTPMTLGGVISGTGSLTQEGAGSTVILAGNNTYTGATTISAGTLQLGNGGVQGSINEAGNITDNGALVFDTSLSSTPYSGVISGSGSVTQAGTSTLYLTGTNTYTGGTTVDAGSTLALGQGGNTGTIVGDVTDNGTLVFNIHGTQTFAGVFTGNGIISQQGGNTLTLTGDSSATFTGEYLVGAPLAASGTDVLGETSSVLLEPEGTLDLSAADSSQTIGSLASSAPTDTDENVLLGSNTLTEGDSASTTFAGVISGAGGSFVKQGTGTFTATGANTYGGGTTINAGTFLADNTSGSATGSGNVTVANGGVLGGSGIIAPLAGNAVTVLSGGNIAPGVASTGTVATGDLTFVNASTNQPLLTFDAPSGSTATTPQLSFTLGTGSGPTLANLTLAGSSSYITISNTSGNPVGEVVFNGNYVSLTDISSGKLVYGDYLLIQAPTAADYANLTVGSNDEITSGLYIAPNTAFEADYSAVLEMQGGDIYVDVEAVPEPGTWALLLGGFVILLAYRARQARRQGV